MKSRRVEAYVISFTMVPLSSHRPQSISVWPTPWQDALQVLLELRLTSKQTGERATRLFSCLLFWFQLSTELDHLPSLWGIAAGYTVATAGSLAANSSSSASLPPSGTGDTHVGFAVLVIIKYMWIHLVLSLFCVNGSVENQHNSCDCRTSGPSSCGATA